MRITKSEISMRTWRSPMSAASQGAFVDIPEIDLLGIGVKTDCIVTPHRKFDDSAANIGKVVAQGLAAVFRIEIDAHHLRIGIRGILPVENDFYGRAFERA